MGVTRNKIGIIQKIENSSIIIIVSLLVSGFFLFSTINFPYVGYNAWNFNAYTLIAENYTRFGFLQTKFAPIISLSLSMPEYYLHHPVLLYVIMGIFTTFLGNEFWVGRSVVIICTLLSLLAIYLIGIELKGKQYASIAVMIAALLPATSIFGRMIGHEPLVLLFILLSILFLVKYIKKEKKAFLYFSVFFVVLGTLSDWPMVYFTFFLFPYLLKAKKVALWTILFTASAVTSLAFIFYIYLLLGSFSDLFISFTDRSIGALLQLPFWPLRWAGTIGVRILVYFNPVIVLFSSIYFYSLLRSKHKTDLDYLLAGLFLFGFFHILLYPEGSFGHPYWIQYLLPFIVFSSSAFLSKIKLNKCTIQIILFFIFMMTFLITIEQWKRKEVLGNVWRYEIMKDVDAYIPKGESVLINRTGAIDLDLIRSRFHRNVEVYEENTSALSYFIYSCMGTCDKSTQPLLSFVNKYAYHRVSKKEGEAYVFFLKSKILSKDSLNNNEVSNKKSKQRISNHQQKERLLRSIYTELMTLLQAPQL